MSLANLALHDDNTATVDMTDVEQSQQIIPTYVVEQMHCRMGQLSNSMLMVRKTGPAANGSEEPPTVLENAEEAPRSTPQPTSDADATLGPIDRHDRIQSQSGSSHEDRLQQHGSDDYVEISINAELAAQLESGSNTNSRDENVRRRMPLQQRLNRLRQSAEATVNEVAPDDMPRTGSAKKSLKDFHISKTVTPTGAPTLAEKAITARQADERLKTPAGGKTLGSSTTPDITIIPLGITPQTTRRSGLSNVVARSSTSTAGNGYDNRPLRMNKPPPVIAPIVWACAKCKTDQHTNEMCAEALANYDRPYVVPRHKTASRPASDEPGSASKQIAVLSKQLEARRCRPKFNRADNVNQMITRVMQIKPKAPEYVQPTIDELRGLSKPDPFGYAVLRRWPTAGLFDEEYPAAALRVYKLADRLASAPDEFSEDDRILLEAAYAMRVTARYNIRHWLSLQYKLGRRNRVRAILSVLPPAEWAECPAENIEMAYIMRNLTCYPVEFDSEAGRERHARWVAKEAEDERRYGLAFPWILATVEGLNETMELETYTALVKYAAQVASNETPQDLRYLLAHDARRGQSQHSQAIVDYIDALPIADVGQVVIGCPMAAEILATTNKGIKALFDEVTVPMFIIAAGRPLIKLPPYDSVESMRPEDAVNELIEQRMSRLLLHAYASNENAFFAHWDTIIKQEHERSLHDELQALLTRAQTERRRRRFEYFTHPAKNQILSNRAANKAVYEQRNGVTASVKQAELTAPDEPLPSIAPASN